MDSQIGKSMIWVLLLMLVRVSGQMAACPSPETILPCICTNRNEDIQIWCTHSDLPQVLKGVKKVGDFIKRPIDELIIENNYLPSLPGKIFQNVKILRLMLRHNGLERLSAGWLETQEMNLVEIFIVENDLKSLPAESLLKMKNLQAITIQAHHLKRIPTLVSLPKLRYVNIQSANLNIIQEHTFESLPNLERLFIKGSPNLKMLKENAFYNLPKLRKLEITNCGINLIHMRALSLLPSLSKFSLSNNKISDATMVGRATRDLPSLSLLNLNHNSIDKLNEGAFVAQPMLESIFLSNNNINVIHHGAFHRVPKLRVVDLNYNRINRIHPESFLQQSSSGVEELNLIGNQITHISEFRALLDALPRLKFLDMSENLLEEIPRGALRGHPSLERLHLNKNSIKFIQAEAFVAMPALRELHLANNSLSDINEGPFWNLPALKGLDISNNFFQRLQPKLLYNLPALRRINLSNNQLSMIDPITFIETPLLEYVNISENALVSVHPATFRNLEHLYEVDVSSNRLMEFVPGLPRGLEQLFLQRNQIANLPVPPSPDLDLPSLRILDISNNGVQKIPNGCMKTLHNLRKLYVKRNGLRQIDAYTFKDLERLEILDLGDNQIMAIHPKSFNKLAHLKHVNLHGNTIESFDFMVIQENAALSALDFSKNKLKSINPTLVNIALEVEIFNVSTNNLNELPLNLNVLSKLKILDASHNHIKQFDGNILNNLNTLTEFKMPHNRLIELRTGSFEDLKNLTTINLENNLIEIVHTRAISKLPNLVSIYLGGNHIVDISDQVFTNLPKLRIIELQGNRLQFISLRAFENIPLVQYLNLSNNQLTSIENSGLLQLSSLEVLDLSFNRLSKITRSSFQHMEWIVELNLDNNLICSITGQPFDYMSRLKILSLRSNKIAVISEATFVKLRNNIAILDIEGNPLICNCKLIWLKSWLLESTAIGPKCSDGTYVKGMPFSRNDCQSIDSTVIDDEVRSCVTHENEALLPVRGSSQVFSTIDKIKDYATQIKNNYHVNKINNRPSPEESEYFYDEYVDYPYNDTLINNIGNELQNNINRTQDFAGKTPLITVTKDTTTNNKNAIKNTATSNAPSSGFTFFGMPLPSLDVGKLFNTGRKIDLPDGKPPPSTMKSYEQVPPMFETGGFTPVLPTTAGGFMPIPGPTQTIYENGLNSLEKRNKSSNTTTHAETIPKNSNIELTTPSMQNIHNNNSTHQKIKTEIHELEAYIDDDNSTHVAYNRIKNVEEQKIDPKKTTKYNLMESNVTITQVTEKEGLLITTDTTNDMSLHAWLDSSTASYSSTAETSKPPIKKHVDSQPKALSAILIPSNEDLAKMSKNNNNKRPATVTKVQVPHVKQYDVKHNYSPVINREGKTHFSESLSTMENTKTRNADGKDWYFKNYNNSNLKPFIAPEVLASRCTIMIFKSPLILISFYVALK